MSPLWHMCPLWPMTCKILGLPDSCGRMADGADCLRPTRGARYSRSLSGCIPLTESRTFCFPLTLMMIASLTACTVRKDANVCASLLAIDPAQAAAAALSDEQRGTAKVLAVYGRHAIETPGAPEGLSTSGVRILPTSTDGDCSEAYEHSLVYARRYNEMLWSLRRGGGNVK
jgi:hypothetical protein